MSNNTDINQNRLWPKPLLGIIIIVSGILFWIIASNLQLYSKIKFPYVEQVFNALGNLGAANIFRHIGSTLSRVLIGLTIGSVLGFVIGLLMTWNKYIDAALDLVIEILRPIPPIALIPFFILWFGIGNTGKYLLISWGCFMMMVINTVEAVKNLPPVYSRAAATLGAGKYKIYKTVIIPGILPSLIGGIRVASAFAFGVTVAAEFMGAEWGLGYMIIVARRTLNTASVLIGVIIIGFLSWLVDKIIRRLALHLTRWTESRGG